MTDMRRKRKSARTEVSIPVAVALVVVLAVTCFVIILGWHAVREVRESGGKVKCLSNLRQVALGMFVYAETNKGVYVYPDPNRWCDLLIEQAQVPVKILVCPGGSKPAGRYALNPSAEPNGPDDMVLLFETEQGWNKYGGPELLTLENHKGEGCNVVFNDGHVEFVEADRIGELKW